MGNSLGMSLYLFAAGRASGRAAAAEGGALPPPPRGMPRIWLHAPQAGECVAVMAALACRLRAARRGLGLILTHPEGAAPAPGRVPAECLVHPALPQDPAQAQAAMAAWAPGALVLGDGPLPPALVHAAETAGVPGILVNATRPRVDPEWSGVPGLQRALLKRLRRILARDGAAARAFRKAGAPPWRIEEAGEMAVDAGALPHNVAERDALARRIGTRPLWLAMAVPEAEEETVLAAHAAAQRLAHRLLLVLVPADPARGPALAEAVHAAGLGCARRTDDDEPSDDDQVYIADTEGEEGLWYRLAPVSFFGGTLAPGGADSRDPMEAAALGSAVVHGPATATHAESYARLARARADWQVSGTEALAEAVLALIAPERTAQMARAGWAVATEGAEVTDRVVELLLATLDEAPA